MFVRNSRHDRLINLRDARELRLLDDDKPKPPLHPQKYRIICSNGDDEVFYAPSRSVEFASAVLIPAGPSDIAIIAYGAVENGDICVELTRHKIVAWAFHAGCDIPEAITATDGALRQDNDKIAAILRPDGRLDVPFDAIYDNEDALIEALTARIAGASKDAA